MRARGRAGGRACAMPRAGRWVISSQMGRPTPRTCLEVAWCRVATFAATDGHSCCPTAPQLDPSWQPLASSRAAASQPPNWHRGVLQLDSVVLVIGSYPRSRGRVFRSLLRSRDLSPPPPPPPLSSPTAQALGAEQAHRHALGQRQRQGAYDLICEELTDTGQVGGKRDRAPMP